MEKLVTSKDSFDRDVALTLITKIKDRSKYYLALSILNDEVAYLILDAAELLWQDYPGEVLVAINQLVDDQNENVRNRIKQIIEKIDFVA